MKETQRQKIASWLLKGHKITDMQALRKFKCRRLGARIYELKKLDFDIESKFIKVKDRDGETCHVKQYWMK